MNAYKRISQEILKTNLGDLVKQTDGSIGKQRVEYKTKRSDEVANRLI